MQETTSTLMVVRTTISLSSSTGSVSLVLHIPQRQCVKLCQHPFLTSSCSSKRRGLSSALSSLLGEEGVVSLSTHTLPLPGLLLTAALGGRLPAGAVGGLPAVKGLLPPVA